ncbi:MAG TPA: peptidase dimerization domain-containing protein, partial [Myxococcales bacterium]|nr:peptidase dimerization domain-containing protein [Myxococcales bacterium]
PVVQAAHLIVDLQTIVSREIKPTEAAVITVGSIHGGTKYNIIPDEVKLQITLRTFNPEVRKLLLSGIERTAKTEAAAARAPKDPLVKVSESQDSTYNDPPLTRRLAAVLAKQLGAENVQEIRPEMVAEDFGEFGKAAGVPSVQLRVGAVEPSRYEASKKAGTPLPSLHSSGFAPDRERTIKTAATVLTLSALELLAKP